MRIRMIQLFQVLLAICLAPAFAQSAGGTGIKTLLILGLPRATDPVRIKVMDGATELKSDGRPFPNAWETTFEGGDDWITDLSFVIKNVSPKKITCIIVFSVPVEAPFWQDESRPKLPTLSFIQNRTGQRPEHALPNVANGRTFPPDTNAPFELVQGEEFTMPIEDPKDYPALQARIENHMLPISNVTAMEGGTVTVFFEDGTRWVSTSNIYSRPAEQPGKWTRISYGEWAGRPKTPE
jgi:hypothetical protein